MQRSWINIRTLTAQTPAKPRESKSLRNIPGTHTTDVKAHANDESDVKATDHR